MSRLRFSKLSGAGNDFVLLESRAGLKLRELARRLCGRRWGVGADGLLAVSRRPLGLRYFNADGSEAFCGNGSRCAAWWMRRQGWVKGREFRFKSSAGELHARIERGGAVSIRMPSPKAIRLNLKLKALSLTSHFLNTGVPHAVVPVKDLESLDVETLGRAVRFHKVFGRAGANADFVRFERGGVRVRTYERGVEAETSACGTGAVAAAAAARLLRGARSPVAVIPRSGRRLRVHFREKDGAFSQVWLEGPAVETFRGEIEL